MIRPPSRSGYCTGRRRERAAHAQTSVTRQQQADQQRRMSDGSSNSKGCLLGSFLGVAHEQIESAGRDFAETAVAIQRNGDADGGILAGGGVRTLAGSIKLKHSTCPLLTFAIRVRHDRTEALLIFSRRDESADHCVLLWHIAQRRAADLTQPELESRQCPRRGASNRNTASPQTRGCILRR
jgi:hypothetical protein